jgi:simple sugar transport system permease protein
MVLGAMAAILAGAAWALPAGLIRAYRNGHEVITTIMLNNVAALVTTALVAGPFKAVGHESPSTSPLAPNQRMPMILTSPFDLSPALCIAILMAAGLAWWLTSTVRGYELRAAGASPVAATFAGIDTKAVLWRTMSISGGIAGLGGAMLVLGSEGRFYSGFSPGYGFDALGVALLAGGSAIALLPASLFFGALSKGGTSIQILGVPKGITTVVLGLVILVAAALRYRRKTNG